MSGLITAGQRKMIYGVAAQNNIAMANLHSQIYRWTGVGSVAKLTKSEAATVIDNLLDMLPERKAREHYQAAYGKISRQQRNYLLYQAKAYGWTDAHGEGDEKSVNAWLGNKFGIACIDWLDGKTANKAIEGMKAMIKRKKEQREGRHEDHD